VFVVAAEEALMRRGLIFMFLFPAIATVSAYAIIYLLTGAVVDSVSGPAWVYLVCMAPGLLLALIDWGFSKSWISPVVGTSLISYTGLVGFLAWDGSARWIAALGFIGVIPAAASSWLINRQSGLTP
jgi:hypothetical protein